MYKRMRLILIILAVAIVLAIIILVMVQSRGAEPRPPQEVVPYSTVNSDAVSPATMIQQGAATEAPVDVVRRYFDSWSAQDTAGMDVCLIAKDRGTANYDDLEYEAAVTLLSIEERPSEEAVARFNPDWYELTPADIALVMTDYTIEYNEAGKALYLRDGLDRDDYQFWLIREKTDSKWVIIMQGY